MNTVKNYDFDLPILYKIGGRNQVLIWCIGFKNDMIYTKWGTYKQYLENKYQESSKVVTRITGGELHDRALLEAKSLWNEMITRDSYSEQLTDKSIFEYGPSLANTWDPKKSQIKRWPIWVECKLDGLRVRAHTLDYQNVLLISRNSDEISFLQHLKSELLVLLNVIKNVIVHDYPKNDPLFRLDGELFTKMVNFDDINGIGKRKLSARNDEKYIQYYIFDIILSFDLTYDQRWNLLNKAFNLYDDCIHDDLLIQPKNRIYDQTNKPILYLLYPTVVNNAEQVLKMHDVYVKNGYEGIILRKIGGNSEKEKSESYYKCVRSSAIYKYKSFLESEFVVVDAKTGIGREDGAIIWTLVNNKGDTFSCKPEGDIGERIKMYNNYIKNPEEYIGCKYRCKYFELTKNGIPRFPVGLGFVHDR